MQKQPACNQEAIGYSQHHLLVACQIHHRLRLASVHARLSVKGIIAAQALGVSELSPFLVCHPCPAAYAEACPTLQDANIVLEA